MHRYEALRHRQRQAIQNHVGHKQKPRGTVSNRNVSLMDVFPTLTELCGLPEKQGLSGRSLIPLLKDPNTNDWSRPIVTVEGWEHYSIRKDDWHYIEYGDGTAELYNLAKDPEEWRNLVGGPQYTKEVDVMRRHIPQERKEYTKTKPIRWADVLSGETKF